METTKGNYGVRHLYKQTTLNGFCECGAFEDSSIHFGHEIYIPVKEAEEARRKFMDGQILKEGTKKDEGKPRWELIAYDALGGIAKILTLGAVKYAARNWEKGIMYGRVYGAIMRHLTAWWLGESKDNESGLSHLDHAMCELMFLSAYEKRGMTQFDDRPTTVELEIKANS